MVRRVWWLMALAACSPPAPAPSDAGTHQADSALAQRFPADVLPWAVSSAATAPGLTVTAGINAQVRLSEPRYRPVALSPDRVAVVFPPGDRPGFDVAFGGLGLAWQREPLSPIAPAEVASLDAVPDGVGGAWVALRLVDRRQRLVLLHWAPGRAVETERLDFPVALNPLRVPYLEACNDLVLGVAPGGALDLIVRSDPNPLETVLFHGRRRGASPFTWTQVVNGRFARAPVLQGSAWDFGCKSALSYDGLGRAVLAVLLQQTSLTGAGLEPRVTAVFTEGRDGRFWPKEDAFMTIASRGPSDHRGLLDLASHPSGYVFGGPAVALTDLPAEQTVENPSGTTAWAYLDAYHPYFPRSQQFTGERRAMSDFRFATLAPERLIARDAEQRVPRRGGKVLADGCGQFSLAVTDWDEPDVWRFSGLGPRCDDPRPAPIFRSTFAGTVAASFAHGGEAPYALAVCLDTQRRSLGVCFGAHEGRAEPPTPTSALGANRLVAASVRAGQTGVPVTHVLELEFDAPLRDEARAAELFDLDVADRLFGTWARVPGTTARYAFTPRTPFAAQHHYRVVVRTQNLVADGPPFLAAWETPQGRHEVFDFVTDGPGPVISDVWAQPFGVTSQLPRDDAGVPFVFVDDAALAQLGVEPIRLHLTGQVADDTGRTPIDAGALHGPDGGLLAVVPIELDARWIDVPAPRDAGERETWSVSLPVLFDRHGRNLEDRVVRVETGWFPLFIRGATPTPGEVVALPPAAVRLEVNRPDPELHTNATAFLFTEVSALDGGLDLASVPFTFQAAPHEVRLTPATPLRAGASYRVVSLLGAGRRVATEFSVAP